MKIHNFKKLEVWKKAMDLATIAHRLTKKFPVDERFGLISQIQRSAISIPSNIAEGSARQSGKDFKRFISVSMGSAFELETQMLLASNFGYISDDELAEFEAKVSEVQKMMFGLYTSLNN